MKGFAFFRRTNVQLCWNLVSFHSPHSLTWSWILNFSLFRGDEARWWPFWWAYRDNNGLQWTARIPGIGLLRWSRQQPMFYRDMWNRARDERDRARYDASRTDHLAARPAATEDNRILH